MSEIFFTIKKTFCSVQMSFLSSAAHLLMVLWVLAIANIATVINMFSTWLFHLLCTYTQECGFWVRWSFYPFPHREQPLCFLQWFCFVSTATLYKISISSTFLSKHVILCLLGIINVSSEKQNLTLSLMCIFLIINYFNHFYKYSGCPYASFWEISILTFSLLKLGLYFNCFWAIWRC